MDQLFLEILDMSLLSSYVIIVVICARMLLKKQSKIFSYILWAVVFFRLIIPFSFESIFSLIPRRIQGLQAEITYSNQAGIHTGVQINEAALVSHGILESGTVSNHSLMDTWITIFTVMWMIGIVALFVYSIVSMRRLYAQLKDAKWVSDNIYESNTIRTPFVLGWFKPRIYLPVALLEKERKYILIHEQIHIKRYDPIFKAAAFFILCIHWFNPFVWIAFWLMSEDMELSCDESVLKKMGPEIKKDYSISLLSLSVGKKIIGGHPLAFGEDNIKGRIMNILNYKKPAFWIVIVAILAVTLLFFGLLSNPKVKPLTVTEYAEQYIQEEVDAFESAEWSEFKIVETKITKLEKLAEFDEILSEPVEIWSLEYRLKPDDIDKVSLAGGMNAVDGWLTEDSSMGKPMLVFKHKGDSVEYLGCMRSGESDFTTIAGQETALQIFFEEMKLLPYETYSGEHIIVKFPLSTGETCQLLLSQPIVQGDSGIWCVERWMDGNGNLYYETPRTEKSQKEYYRELQQEKENGKLSYLSEPLQVALHFINGELRQFVSIDDLKAQYSVKAEDFIETPESQYIGYISKFEINKYSKSSFHLDQIEWLTADNDAERLNKLGVNPQDLPNGYYIYNPNHYPMFCQVTEETSYYVIKQGSTALQSVTLEEFLKHLKSFSGSAPPFHVVTKDGYVQSISEQYMP
ncbi:M56 family metallopeptidase [Sinanaerobacter sp. ZZT-01]|uniref:M56 family metallopeptidase n=1 Tax=Sinanaerobacter sp. ZZT-01 TaxID=3111540 RepID=UPI002D77443C|nr:M56 family metallopeptidase [Sinanaerobacter sp. ZZT-01]WRR92465.1 M56 family metallopeptidase [Sinanaerobacter sp. ZZT-01]